MSKDKVEGALVMYKNEAIAIANRILYEAERMPEEGQQSYPIKEAVLKDEYKEKFGYTIYVFDFERMIGDGINNGPNSRTIVDASNPNNIITKVEKDD